MTKYIGFAIILCGLFSCGEKSTKGRKPIVFGDSSTIVNETDSTYLENYTEDISSPNNKSSAKSIAEMMVEVDSLKAQRKLEESNINAQALSGLEVAFKDFKVVFNGLVAHSANASQDINKGSSVSYIYDAGEVMEMKMKLEKMTDAQVEQKISSKLGVKIGSEFFVLSSLGIFHSSWYNLVGKENIFISTGNNGLQFSEVNNQKIKIALSAAMKAKNKSSKQINEALKLIDKTNSAIDPPCKIVVSALQFNITGMVGGKKTKKLIRFDMPM